MIVKSLFRFVIPFLFFTPFYLAQADEGGNESYADDFLLGDWEGTRSSLADKGIEFEFIFTADFYNLDYYSDTTGKSEKENVDLNNTDITVTIDGEKAFDLKDSTFFMYILGDGGDDPSGEFVGDTQGFDNIESPDTIKIHELWYQQNFDDDKFSLLFGLYDLNSEFDVIETAGLFSGSSHGVGPDLSQSGESGPSIFPAVSLALRGLYNITDNAYVQAVILDGVPGDPDDPDNKNAAIKLKSTDGYLATIEVGHVSSEGDSYQKFSLGFWSYTKATQDNIAAGDDIKNRGAYASADANVYQESGDPAQGLNVFIRYGFAEDKINEVKTYSGAGVVYTGLIPGRDEDQFGIGVAIVNPTDSFKSGESAAEAETAIEISYYAQITPWLGIKPDIQFIENPGMVNNKADATVAGIRVEVSF